MTPPASHTEQIKGCCLTSQPCAQSWLHCCWQSRLLNAVATQEGYHYLSSAVITAPVAPLSQFLRAICVSDMGQLEHFSVVIFSQWWSLWQNSLQAWNPMLLGQQIGGWVAKKEWPGSCNFLTWSSCSQHGPSDHNLRNYDTSWKLVLAWPEKACDIYSKLYLFPDVSELHRGFLCGYCIKCCTCLFIFISSY